MGPGAKTGTEHTQELIEQSLSYLDPQSLDFLLVRHCVLGIIVLQSRAASVALTNILNALALVLLP